MQRAWEAATSRWWWWTTRIPRRPESPEALRPHAAARLLCLFGCGGDRDAGKRPLMAAIAERLADGVLVTDDNPRTEASAAIIADIRKGFAAADKVTFPPSR